MTPDNNHRQVVLESIRKLERHTLPESARANPFNFNFDRNNDERKAKRSRFAKLPWFLSVSIEGASLGMLALLMLLLLPKFFHFFEERQRIHLESFGVNDTNSSLSENDMQEELLSNELEDSGEGSDNVAQEEELEESESEEGPTFVESDPNVVAGDSEIWRFYIKSESPEEMRPQVTSLLKGLNVPESTEGLTGLKAPGGIMFKLIVASEIVPTLKVELERLTTPSGSDPRAAEFNLEEHFTWYKSRYSKRLPKGHVQLVVWISRV